MSSVRLKKRAPLAYVPVEPNKIVAVPIDTNVPRPDAPDAAENYEYFQDQAERLASPLSPEGSTNNPKLRPSGPKRSRSRTVDLPSSPPIVTPPKRQAASVKSRDSLVNERTESPQQQRGSWFVDHVMRPRSSTVRSSPRPEPPRVVSSDIQSVTSVASVEVIIPDEARSHLGQALASQENVERGSTMSSDALHHNDIVEHLDVIDAHISTVSHLSNAANSILVPPIAFYSRKPVINLPTRFVREDEERRTGDELDRHVEDVLSKRALLKRSLQGLWAFLKTPIGVATGIYGFLVVFWGAAIVFFLAKWINLHNPYQQGFWVEISSQVVNALFTVQGVGFLPWRMMDTWNIFWISHYDRLDQRLRREAKLPPIGDVNDIPDHLVDTEHVQVLTDKQLESLRRHQVRFMKSQTWYRPHATATHKAFSIKYALAICLCLDLNSVFQILLCICMWGFNRFQRPPWTIGSLIPLGFISGIAAAVLIWKGGEQSKKTQEVEERLRQALEQEKQVLVDRYGPEHVNTPVLVEKPSASSEKELVPRDSAEMAQRNRSPLRQTLHIDEIMSIPEEQEDSTVKSSPAEKLPFTLEKEGNGVNEKEKGLT